MVVLIALYALRAQRELSLVVEDNLTQERAVLTSTPPSSPKPARLPPSSQLLPLLTLVVQPAQKPRSQRRLREARLMHRLAEQSLDNVQVDVTSVGSSRSVSSAILRSENIMFRVMATRSLTAKFAI